MIIVANRLAMNKLTGIRTKRVAELLIPKSNYACALDPKDIAEAYMDFTSI